MGGGRPHHLPTLLFCCSLQHPTCGARGGRRGEEREGEKDLASLVQLETSTRGARCLFLTGCSRGLLGDRTPPLGRTFEESLKTLKPGSLRISLQLTAGTLPAHPLLLRLPALPQGPPQPASVLQIGSQLSQPWHCWRCGGILCSGPVLGMVEYQDIKNS